MTSSERNALTAPDLSDPEIGLRTNSSNGNSAQLVNKLVSSRLARGLAICAVMVIIGAVGSLTLHQVISPQTEELVSQRNELRQQLTDLQTQYDNMTRIADSRLEMIHVLEQELQQQASQAAAAADNFVNLPVAGEGGRIGPGAAAGGVVGRSGLSRQRFFMPTIAYTWIIAVSILLSVFYRIYRLLQNEKRPTLHLPTRLSRLSSDSSRLGLHNGRLLYDPAPASSRLYELGEVDAGAEETKTNDENALEGPKLYKRAPGSNSVNERLLHV